MINILLHSKVIVKIIGGENIMKKKNEKTNPVISGMISTFFDIIKHFINDFDNSRKIKKIDRFSEEFSTLEHLMIRLEKKLAENRHKIDDLKSRLLWGNIIIIVLLLVNIFNLVK